MFLTVCFVSPEFEALAFFLSFIFLLLLSRTLLLRAVGSGNAAAVGERRCGTRTVLGVDQCVK